jgi:hypothetical protein
MRLHFYPFRVSYSAKFGTCTVVSVNGTLVEDKMSTFALESTHFIFTLTTVQVPNLELTRRKWFTVWIYSVACNYCKYEYKYIS